MITKFKVHLSRFTAFFSPTQTLLETPLHVTVQVHIHCVAHHFITQFEEKGEIH